MPEEDVNALSDTYIHWTQAVERIDPKKNSFGDSQSCTYDAATYSISNLFERLAGHGKPNDLSYRNTKPLPTYATP